MDSSPSSSHLDASNSADKGAETMLIDGKAPSPPFPSLLDLPDELIFAIYDDVYESLRPDEVANIVGILVPLSLIIVNKRIYRIARPVWFQHLSLPEAMDGAYLFYANLLQRSDALQYATSAYLHIIPDLPNLQLAILSRLKNLEHLVVNDYCYTGKIPRRFTEALRGFVRLESLNWEGVLVTDIQDDSFDFNSGMPRVRSLQIDAEHFLSLLLKRGATNVIKFEIRCGALTASALPVTTARWIALAPEEGHLFDGGETVAAFHRASTRTTSPWPLRRLSFDCIALNSYTSHPTRFNRQHLFALLDTISPSCPSLHRLDFHQVDNIKWPPHTFRMPSLQVLSLQGGFCIATSIDLTSLHSFLCTFPSLSHLFIRNFLFSDASPSTADCISRLSPVQRALQLPMLIAFLAVMRSTAVLEIPLQTAEERREMRWRRTSTKDDFESECWTIG